MRERAVLARMMMRFWLRIVPLARGELREWKGIAMAIPDPQLRGHALDTLRTESFSALGAALVATTIDRHDPALVRSLIALQVAWDYIDTLAEQPAADPVANGVQLHRALLDAVSSSPRRADYYRLNPAHDDGGYLEALVDGCRQACATLPAFAAVGAALVGEMRTAEVQYVNHAPPEQRVRALREWAHGREHEAGDASWIELASAASSSLGVLALLAAGADPATSAATVSEVRAAYVPWIDALTALLDSHVDRTEDAVSGLMNWVGHYPSEAVAILRLREITLRAMEGARRLPHGERHAVIVVGMIAMHLSRPSAWLPQSQAATRAVLGATDSGMMLPLLVLLAAWRRFAAAQRAFRRPAREAPSPSIVRAAPGARGRSRAHRYSV